MNHNQNITKLYFFLGITACITSVSIAIMLYSGFGYSLSERFLYGIVGFVIAIASISLLTASGVLAQKRDYILSFVCFAGWLIAIVFAVFAEIGFMAHAISNTSTHSEQAIATREQVADLEQQITANVAILGLDVTALKSQIAVKQNALQDARTALANCPKGWNKNCITPAQNRINAIQSDLTALKSQLWEYDKVQGLKSLKNTLTMQHDGNIQNMTEVKTDLLFVLIGEFFSVSPQKAMAYFLLATAVFFEILSSLFFLISRKFDESEGYFVEQMATQPIAAPPVEPPRVEQSAIKEKALPVSQWSYPALGDFLKKFRP